MRCLTGCQQSAVGGSGARLRVRNQHRECAHSADLGSTVRWLLQRRPDRHRHVHHRRRKSVSSRLFNTALLSVSVLPAGFPAPVQVTSSVSNVGLLHEILTSFCSALLLDMFMLAAALRLFWIFFEFFFLNFLCVSSRQICNVYIFVRFVASDFLNKKYL